MQQLICGMAKPIHSASTRRSQQHKAVHTVKARMASVRMAERERMESY